MNCKVPMLFAQSSLSSTEATAGTDLVKKCIQGLTLGTGVERIALVDAHGYDTSPALATLEVLVETQKRQDLNRRITEAGNSLRLVLTHNLFHHIPRPISRERLTQFP